MCYVTKNDKKYLKLNEHRAVSFFVFFCHVHACNANLLCTNEKNIKYINIYKCKYMKII